MFVDQAKIFVKAGDGGDGKVSFRRAKYVPNGGPDGGNGGNGGDVIFVADKSLTTLQDFKYKRKYAADDGGIGAPAQKSGKDGQALYVRVPAGTLLKEHETGRVIADLTEDGESVVVSKGGRGGKGNMNFANSVRQSPNFAKPGQIVLGLYVDIELKLLADIGLIGLPNVGKSTLLSVLSSAKPKIADYHFTTLSPNLGICQVDDFYFTVADIPGLIEGASDGFGLGHDFLKHIERTRLLVHVVDVSGAEGRNPLEDIEIINAELARFDAHLSDKKQIIVATKIDLSTDEDIEAFIKTNTDKGLEVFPICAPIHEGIKPLLYRMASMLKEIPPAHLPIAVSNEKKIYKYEPEAIEIVKENEIYVVNGPWVDYLVRSTNFEDVESLQHFQNQLKRKGIIQTLIDKGIQEGDTVSVEGIEFEYIP